MNKTLFLPLIILFFALYYFLFPLESNSEIVWTTAYCEPLKGMDPSSLPFDEPLVLNQGRNKAVISAKEGINFVPESDFDGYLSSTHAFYKKEDIVYLREFGLASFAVTRTPGFPLVLGERYFVIDYGSASIEEFDSSGRSLWSWQGLAPVTALAWNQEFIVAGSLDGIVRLIDTSGNVSEFQGYPAEEDYVVYAVALSDDSGRLSIISGLRNQYLRTYSLGDDPKILAQVKLESHFRRPVKMYYSDNAEYLWVEQDDGLLQYSDDNQPVFFPVENSFLTMKYDSGENLIYILSTGRGSGGTDQYYLKAFSPEAKLIFENKSEFFPDSFQLDGSDVLFSLDDKIMILTRREL